MQKYFNSPARMRVFKYPLFALFTELVQTCLWFFGIAVHNHFSDECTSDFNCCNKGIGRRAWLRFSQRRERKTRYGVFDTVNRAFIERFDKSQGRVYLTKNPFPECPFTEKEKAEAWRNEISRDTKRFEVREFEEVNS